MSNIRITDRAFFTQPAEKLAQDLIGKILCRKIDDGTVLRYRIIETEAYCHDDSATHSNKYKTGNAVECQNMIGGTIYVHDNYKNSSDPGSSFDIVANEENINEGVLIRGGENIDNGEIVDSKPIILGQKLQIVFSKLNKADIVTSEEIWLEDDGGDYPFTIQKRKGLKNITPEDMAKERNYKLRK